MATEVTRNDQYVDGSIMRIRLHNFLTYSDAELFPGPRLNLVIGPNGTGKSSIVCALCVGLGGSTKVLGRAEKLGDFVQHEKDSGFTEIELYFKKKSIVIRRNIYRDNRSTWFIDGKDASQNKVKEILSKASIQIDNLCQFLPQDKVGDFSRMSPNQLLKATQAAIGNGELAEQQEEIIRMEKENSSSNNNLEAARSRLETKRSENAQRQRDVERIREQEARRTELDNLEKKLLWVQFEEQKRHVEVLKNRKNEFKEKLSRAKSVQIDPLISMLAEQKTSMETGRSTKDELIQEKKALEKKLDNLKHQLEHKETEENNTMAEIQALKDRQREIAEKLIREKEKMDKLVDELGLLREDELKEEFASLNARLSPLEEQIFNFNSTRDNDKRMYSKLQNDFNRIEGKLAQLENAQTQKQRYLASRDRNAMQAYEWVKKNSSRFQRKVWGPLALEVQVNHKLHAKYLEDTVQKYLLTAFVTECRDDYDIMVRELNEGSQRLGVTVMVVQDGRIQQYRRPYTNDQLDHLKQEYGMKCYLDEVITAPPIIHQVLRDHGGIHTMLVGSQQTEDLINKNVDVCGALASMYSKAAFLTPVTKYVSTVSKYGNRDTTTRTNSLREPQYIAVSSDTRERQEQMIRERQDISNKMKQVQNEIDSRKSQEKVLLDEKHAISTEIQNVRTKLRRYNQLVDYVEHAKNRVRGLEREAAKDASDTEESLRRKLHNVITKHVKLLGELGHHVAILVKCNSNQVECELGCSVMEQKLLVIQRVITEEETKLQRLKDEYEETKELLRTYAKRAVEFKTRAERAAPWETFEVIFNELPDDTIEIQAQIENIRIALAHFRGDLRVVEIYERVQHEIEEEEAELERLESSFATLQERISAIKDPWYRQLKQVVGNINASFSQYFKDIGCVGEIHLNEVGDISKWGIERRAQFRMTGKLTTMTAEEQSGGEKSVGTIMYLMALQSLTKCPFRVVDEINQGMDIYNERKVFSRITKSSCGNQLPQYFLITPKLITGLQYHPDTKVLVILNGPYNINQTEWNMKEFLSKRQRLN